MQFVQTAGEKKAKLNNRYEFMELLGRGQSSEVHTALDKRTNAKVVIKIIKTEYLLSSLNNQKLVEGEMHAMDHLNH